MEKTTNTIMATVLETIMETIYIGNHSYTLKGPGCGTTILCMNLFNRRITLTSMDACHSHSMWLYLNTYKGSFIQKYKEMADRWVRLQNPSYLSSLGEGKSNVELLQTHLVPNRRQYDMWDIQMSSGDNDYLQLMIRIATEICRLPIFLPCNNQTFYNTKHFILHCIEDDICILFRNILQLEETYNLKTIKQWNKYLDSRN